MEEKNNQIPEMDTENITENAQDNIPEEENLQEDIEVAEEKPKMSKRKRLIITLSIVIPIMLLAAAAAVAVAYHFDYIMDYFNEENSSESDGGIQYIDGLVVYNGEVIGTVEEYESGNVGQGGQSATGSQKQENSNKNNNSSTNKNNNSSTQKDNSQGSSSSDASSTDDANKSEQPDVTICTQVAPYTFVVGGICSKETEYVRVTGNAGVAQTDIIPTAGKDKNYFIGQVKVLTSTKLHIQGKETGLELSKQDTRTVSVKNMKDYTKDGEYAPIFGKNSQMHFYSALLSYSLSNALSADQKSIAQSRISSAVADASSVGAEVIFFVVPSSAEIYPETVPDEFPKASGETIYKSFYDIATRAGAKVIYPKDTMLAHKNDGTGYKIYNNTDSHWTTYGAYWGIHDLMSHISQKYPAAAPRSVAEMGFYTTELHGGDAFFNFSGLSGFETNSNGRTEITKIKEFTTLYSLKMHTNELYNLYRGNQCVFVKPGYQPAASTTNPNGAGLPSALILNDSFRYAAYDMINDRFSNTWWQKQSTYDIDYDILYGYRPNYVIYMFSERNLTRIMLGNEWPITVFA